MTALAKQLAALARPQTQLPAGTKASLLFDVREAAKIDKDIIFAIGANGLDELRQIDDRFLFVYSDLFESSYADSHYSRDVLPASEVASLDSKLLELLPMLSPHFLSKGCHKVFEFLIRFYQVHIYARDKLLLFLMPFHDTKVWVRLVQLMDLGNSDWEWLKNHQKEGAVLIRSDLVTACCRDSRILFRLLETASVSVTHLRFCAILSAEVIGAVPKLSDTLLHIVFPRISQWLAADRESKSAAYILLAQISVRHPLSPDYFNAVLSEIVKSADSDLLPALKIAVFLIKAHPSVSIANSTVDLLMSEQWVEGVATISASCDTRALASLLGKRIVSRIGTEGEHAKSLAETLISIEKLSPDALETLLIAILTQFVTQKKSREAKDFPVYAHLLSLVADRHPSLLPVYLPKAIAAVRDSHQGEKTKLKLNSLLSKALSGIPMDDNTDLPLYLALNHPIADVRLAAATQLEKCLVAMKAAVLESIRGEENYDVLLAILSVGGLETLNEGEGLLVPALAERLAREITGKCKRVEVFSRILDVVSIAALREAVDFSLILTAFVYAYEEDSLKSLVDRKAAELSQASVGFPHRSEEQTRLDMHISDYIQAGGRAAIATLSGLVHFPVVRLAISAAFHTYKPKTDEEIRDFTEILSEITSALEKIDLKAEEISPLASCLISVCPVLSKISLPDAASSALVSLKRLLKLLLPIDFPSVLSLITRHFRERSLEILTEFTLTSPEALELATNIAILADSQTGKLQAVANALVSLSSPHKSVRIQALNCISALGKGKATMEIEAKIAVADCETLSGDREAVEGGGILAKVSKHRAGIISDPSYFPVILGKSAGTDDCLFLANCVSALKYHRTVLLDALQSVKFDCLSDLLLKVALSRSEKVVVLRRFVSYQSWADLPTLTFIIDLWTDRETMAIVLDIFTFDVFSRLSVFNQSELLLKAVTFLSETRCGELSAELYARIGEWRVSAELLHGLFERKVGLNTMEKVLTVVQEAFVEPQAIVLQDLFSLLRSLSSLSSTPSLEFLKQLTLTSIRLHYPAILQSPSLQSSHLALLVSCVTDSDELALQTKSQMYATLAGCCHLFPSEVAAVVKDCFGSAPLKFASMELSIMKKTIELVATSLLAHRVSLTGILTAVVEGAEKVASECDFPSFVSDILRKVGSEYIPAVLLHMLSLNLPSETVRSVLSQLSILSTLDGLQRLTQLLSLCLLHPKTKAEKKEVRETICQLKAERLVDPDEVSLIHVSKLLSVYVRFLTESKTVEKLADEISQESIPELFAKTTINLISARTLIGNVLASKNQSLKHVYKLVGKTVKTAIQTICDLLDSGTFTKLQLFTLQMSEKEAKIELKCKVLDLLLQKVEEDLSPKYRRLIPRLISVLKANSTAVKSIHRPNNQAKAAYLDTILIVLRRLLNDKHETSENFAVILDYSSSKLHQIRSNSLLCLSNFFKSARVDLLPSLSPMLDSLSQHFSATKEESSLRDGVVCACNVIEGMHEFLAPHWTALMQFACSCKVDTEPLLAAIGKRIPLRLALTPALEYIAAVHKTQGKEFSRMLTLLIKLIAKVDSDDAGNYAEELATVYESALTSPLSHIREYGQPHGELLEQAELLASGFASFCLRLTSVSFRPIFVRICEWQGWKEGEECRNFRCFLFFSVLKALARTMKSYFGAFLKYCVEEIVKFVAEFAEVAAETSKKRKRGMDTWAVSVNTLVLQTLSAVFRYDKGTNMNEALYDQLSTAVVSELALVAIPDYSTYMQEHVFPCFQGLFRSTQDETIWKALNYKLLLQTRSESKSVRVASFRLLTEVGTSVGEPFAALVSDVMPFVGEGLEDEEDEVTKEAREALRMMQKLCGEEVNEYLK